MANDEEVEDLGDLKSVTHLAEGARAGAEDQPALSTGIGEDDPMAAAALPEVTTRAAAPASEDPTASAGPTQVAKLT
jgi:hypothetical protein